MKQNLVPLSEVFDVQYGNRFDFNKMDFCENSEIVFVSRSSKNNGVVAFVEKYKNIEPIRAGAVTVTLGGTYVLSSFIQPLPFYTAQNIAVLFPKKEMNEKEKIYYCLVISKNRFKYGAFGREANRTLKDILVPAEIPKNLEKIPIPKISKKPISSEKSSLNIENWKEFEYQDVFEIYGGFYNKKPEEEKNGDIPFIGSTEYNNGVTTYYTKNNIENSTKARGAKNHSIEKKIFKGNCITISNNGSVGNAFYQEKEFTCSHDVNPVYLKDKKLNQYIALFLCTLIAKEKFRWAYGRKWRPIRMPTSKIKLPVDCSGNPDWGFMENYIKSLPYSASI